MTERDIRLLMSAYGFQFFSEDREQYKMRYQGEFTFVDFWNGKKGITIGVYNPKTKSMWYARPRKLVQLEDILIKATKD